MPEDVKLSRETLALKNYHDAVDNTSSVVPPLYLSATYARDADYELSTGYNYRRYGTPNVSQAEQLLRTLEGGTEALLFSSGLSAVTSLFDTLGSGSRIIAPKVMYHGAQDWFRRLADKGRAELVLFDQTKEDDLTRSIDGTPTDIVWLETPCNPTWDIVDIEKSAAAAHAVGAILVVDSTVAPPCTTRALDHGADIVFHSTTKYLNGHHDITGGVLVTNQVDGRWEEVQIVRKLMGSIISPFDGWLLMRGVRTLFVRFEKSSASAQRIAEHFNGHSRIERVLYPGLKEHPGHATARKQMVNGFGGMLSILVRGDASDAKRIALSTRLFTPATSLGGVESLIEHRKSVEGPHSAVPENLLRLSIGMENAGDLIADLEQALLSQ